MAPFLVVWALVWAVVVLPAVPRGAVSVEQVVKFVVVLVFLVYCLFVLFVSVGHAQTVVSPPATVVVVPPGCSDPANCAADMAVSWVCANQGLVTALLALLLAHGGMSVASSVMKKLGLGWSDSWVVKLVRILAIDAKSPPDAVVAQANKIVQEGGKA